MFKTSVLSPITWTARLNRFRRMMLIEIDLGEQGRCSAVTSNLSRGGLAAICDSPPGPGAAVVIRFAGRGGIPARVVWRAGRRVGIQFERELNLFECFGAQLQIRKWR